MTKQKRKRPPTATSKVNPATGEEKPLPICPYCNQPAKIISDVAKVEGTPLHQIVAYCGNDGCHRVISSQFIPSDWLLPADAKPAKPKIQLIN
jgi:hypothetical protein